jgi:hypothetical protein
MAEALANLDDRAAIILTCHAALEREVDVVLSRLLPRPDKLRNLGFANKITILNAAWRGPADAGDKLNAGLFRFNELRNAVAHVNAPAEIDARIAQLRAAFDQILPDNGLEGNSIEEMAAGLIGFMADRPLERSDLKIGKAAAK